MLILHRNRVEIFENRCKDNQENWVLRTDWSTGIEIFAEHASLGDIDHDGDCDAVFGTANGMLHLFENAGSSLSPRWRQNTSLDRLEFHAHTAPALGDFDGDGDADLLVGWSEGNSSIAIGYKGGKLAYFRNDFIVDVDKSFQNVKPTQLQLPPNYPNPLNTARVDGGTRIQFALPQPGHLKIGVYNLLGQNVRILVDEFRQRGEQSIVWDGLTSEGIEVAPGIHILRLEHEGRVMTRKITLLR